MQAVRRQSAILADEATARLATLRAAEAEASRQADAAAATASEHSATASAAEQRARAMRKAEADQKLRVGEAKARAVKIREEKAARLAGVQGRVSSAAITHDDPPPPPPPRPTAGPTKEDIKRQHEEQWRQKRANSDLGLGPPDVAAQQRARTAEVQRQREAEERAIAEELLAEQREAEEAEEAQKKAKKEQTKKARADYEVKKREAEQLAAARRAQEAAETAAAAAADSPPPPSDAPPAVTMLEATHAYKATSDQEISFSKGTEITLLDKTNDNWWRGRLYFGAGGEAGSKDGYFPASYVREVQLTHVA